MIYFNDVALETVAPVKIEDIRVSPISYTATARQRPIGAGADFVRMTGGTRAVAITFALLNEDKFTRQAQLLAINKWAVTDGEKKLILPVNDGKYLNAVCTALPEPSLRQWWESKLRLVFTCFDDPFWNDIAEKSVACGTEFTVLGSAPPRVRIERTLSAAAGNQTYSNGSQSMTFTSIPAGNLVIDLNRQTAAVDGTSIAEQYTFGSSFLLPQTGKQTITGTGTVKYRERWV